MKGNKDNKQSAAKDNDDFIAEACPITLMRHKYELPQINNDKNDVIDLINEHETFKHTIHKDVNDDTKPVLLKKIIEDDTQDEEKNSLASQNDLDNKKEIFSLKKIIEDDSEESNSLKNNNWKLSSPTKIEKKSSQETPKSYYLKDKSDILLPIKIDETNPQQLTNQKSNINESLKKPPPPPPNHQNKQMIHSSLKTSPEKPPFQNNLKTLNDDKQQLIKYDCCYSGIHYEPKDIYCNICKKVFNPEVDSINYFFQVVPNFFLCKEHYVQYETSKMLPKESEKCLRKLFLKNVINSIFHSPPCYPESVPIRRPYDLFLPTIQYHCEGNLEDIKCEELVRQLGNDVFIYDVEHGSQVIKAAILFHVKYNDFKMAPDDIQKKFEKIFTDVKQKFRPAIQESLIGKEKEKPKLTFPNLEDMNELLKTQSSNILQNFPELDEIEYDELIDGIIDVSRDLTSKEYLRTIIDNINVYEAAEKQIKKDIRNNAFELTIAKESLIINKFDDKYNELKGTVNSKDIVEKFLYHGTKLDNHFNIMNESFKMPGQDHGLKQLDSGWYGKGIYATDNIFYATLYANGYRHLKVNQVAFILYCKVFYNKEKVNELDKTQNGKTMDKDVVDNCGINHTTVGSTNGYKPIKINEKDNHNVVAEEFVFGQKFQILPIFSFEVMRRDHFILWKDDHIDNKENSNYMKDIQKQGVNIYGCKSNEEALNLIKIKKKNKIKLVTNCGHKLLGKQLIEAIRNNHNYYICLVFAMNPDHFNWATKMDNVILTLNQKKFKDFISLKMDKDKITDYIKDIEKMHKVKFQIKENEILHYPNYVDDVTEPPKKSEISESTQTNSSENGCLLI